MNNIFITVACLQRRDGPERPRPCHRQPGQIGAVPDDATDQHEPTNAGGQEGVVSRLHDGLQQRQDTGQRHA